MNVFIRAFAVTVAVAALSTQVMADTVSHRGGSGPGPGRAIVALATFGSAHTDVLMSKKHGQSVGEFKHACDKRNGVVTKRAGKVVCIGRMRMGSMRGSYDRVPAGDPGTVPPQALPHS